MSTYAEKGRKLAQAAKKAKRAKVAAEKPEEPKPAPLPPWLTGDKRSLPMRPPGKGEP